MGKEECSKNCTYLEQPNFCKKHDKFLKFYTVSIGKGMVVYFKCTECKGGYNESKA